MIVGTSGYAGSGKDTVAKYLVETHGFTRIAFADPIRNFLLEINPILDKGLHLKTVVKEYGWDAAKAQTEVRRLLQDLGLGARKIFGEDFWVEQAVRKLCPDGRYIFTDVRFENEAKILKLLGASLWRVERPGIKAVNSHISEHSLDQWDFDVYIVNDSSIEDLTPKIEWAMNYV